MKGFSLLRQLRPWYMAALTLLLVCCLISVANADNQGEGTPFEYRPRLENAYGLVHETVAEAPSKLKDIFLEPVRNPETAGLVALGLAALILVDKPATTWYQDHVETTLDGLRIPSPISSNITRGADGYLMLGVGATYLSGFALNNEKAQRTGLLAAEAITYSWLISHVLLKTLISRDRPNPSLSQQMGDQGEFTGDPFNFGNHHRPYFFGDDHVGGTSMPSFHFTLYFAVARVYQVAYDNYIVPYGLAALGLVSGIKNHQHWMSDMVAGAIIGTVIGTVVTRGEYDDQLKITPVVSEGSMALNFSYQF